MKSQNFENFEKYKKFLYFQMFAAIFFIIQLVIKYANKVVKTHFQFPKNALCIFLHAIWYQKYIFYDILYGKK